MGGSSGLPPDTRDSEPGVATPPILSSCFLVRLFLFDFSSSLTFSRHSPVLPKSVSMLGDKGGSLKKRGGPS